MIMKTAANLTLISDLFNLLPKQLFCWYSTSNSIQYDPMLIQMPKNVVTLFLIKQGQEYF